MQKLDKTTGEKAELLDKTKWARDWEYRNLEAFCGYLDVFEVDPGDIIFDEGSTSLFMFVIADGELDIVKENSLGEQMIIANIGSGQTVGEMSLVDGSSRSAGARASKPSTLLILPKSNFDRICSESPKLGLMIMRKIASLMSQRLRWTSGRLVESV